MIEDVPLNAALINCRSLKPKLPSLKECFKMNDLHISLLNETWFNRSDAQLHALLKDIDQESGIQIIRKDRDSRGGGVAIAFGTEFSQAWAKEIKR